MTVSEKIFEQLKIQGMSQKEFSERTGIAQSAISDWKRKGTSPASDKILIICRTLGITAEELLSGAEANGERSKHVDYYVISKNSSEGLIIESYQNMALEQKARLQGYIEALKNQ